MRISFSLLDVIDEMKNSTYEEACQYSATR
jgi:hypothetical protein